MQLHDRPVDPLLCRWIPVSLLGVLLCAVSFECVAAQAPAPSPAVAQTLLSARGELYVRSRDEALVGSRTELAALRAHLVRDGASDAERTLEAILRARSEDAVASQVLDETIRACFREARRARSGELLCQFPAWTEKTWPLCAELIWKRDDLPMGWRWAGVEALPTHVVPVDPLLVIMRERPEFSGPAAIVLGQIPNAGADDRVYPALVDAFKFIRTRPLDCRGCSRGGSEPLVALSLLGTARAVASLHVAERFERELIAKQGLAPWNDSGQAIAALREAESVASREHEASHPTAEVRAQRVQAADELVQKKREVVENVLLWRAFDRAYELLRQRGLEAERAATQPEH